MMPCLYFSAMPVYTYKNLPEFQRGGDLHGYNTRSINDLRPYYRKSVNRIFYQAVQIFYLWPNEIKISTDNTYKRKFKNILMSDVLYSVAEFENYVSNMY